MVDHQHKTYFPGLNSLRFLAATLVIIFHTESFKRYFPLSYHLSEYQFIENFGKMAVNFFFVLSGYLITYLLIREKKKHQKIFIRDFYLRRILRIWPIYFIVLALSGVCSIFFLSSPEPFNPRTTLLNLLIFPNIAGFYGQNLLLRHLWSIGIEEQFYILWPLLLGYFRSILKTCTYFISFFILLNLGIWTIYKLEALDRDILISSLRFLQAIRMHCLVIGALGAYLFYQKHFLLSFIYHPAVQVFNYALTLTLLFTNIKFPAINNEIYCFLFLIMILNISTNPKSIFKLEYRFSGFLGRISYGMYMYHSFAVYLTLYLFSSIFNNGLDNRFDNFLCHTLALSITIAMASFSYYFIERTFLRIKNQYSKVNSQTEASS